MTTTFDKLNAKITAKFDEIENKQKELQIVREILERVDSVKTWYAEWDEEKEEYKPYDSATTEYATIEHIIELICKEYKL